MHKYTAIALPAHVVGSMPPPVTEAWDKYQAALERWRQAGRDARRARTEAKEAPAHDAAAAVAAVEKGKSVPAARTPGLEDLAERAGRTGDALVVMARRAERDYVTAAEQHRAEWLDGSLARAQVSVDVARDAVGVAETARAEAAELFSTWKWLRFAEQLNRVPTLERVAIDFQAIRTRLDRLDPDVIESEAAAEEAAAAAQREETRRFRERGGY